tara:strand:- start:283 stop:1128 length:846 start_codon:yes stop_codon:yes gene_type:complete
MPFIGKQPEVGAYSKLDAITTSATATYNLTLGGGAYYPSSANHLLVSLNGVMQAPQDSFTVSGSTIVFASALTSSDNIDFIMALGDVLDIGTPSDGTVTSAKIVSGAVTDAKIVGMSSSKLTGALPALDGSALTGTTPAIVAGDILQKVVKSSGTVVTVTNSGNYNGFGLSQSFTPILASSIILIEANVAGEHYGSNTDRGIRYEIRQDGTQAQLFPYMDYHSSDNSQNISTQKLVAALDATNTSARTYDVVFRCSASSNASARVNNYNGPSYLVITEVAR